MGEDGEATTMLLATEMGNGQKAGLCVMGMQYNSIGIEKEDGMLKLFADLYGNKITQSIKYSRVYLRVKVSTEPGTNQFFFSTDNKSFQPFGEPFRAGNGNWKGPKIGLFSFSEEEASGKALFDWFHYVYDGPKQE